MKKLLEAFAKVTNWAEPRKVGRSVYDDKAFYESLLKQYNNGKVLSPKQVAALKKLGTKYSIVIG